MLRHWKRISSTIRSILSLWLSVLVLAGPGTGAGQLVKDTTRLAAPVVGRGIVGTIAAFRAAVRVSPVALLLAGVETASADAPVKGNPWTWGNSENPAPVTGLNRVTAIAEGSAHRLTLKADGTVWTWGDNFYGQLGDGGNTSSNVPIQVAGPGGVGYFTGTIAIAGAWTHSLAVKIDGTVWAWGDNRWGQLGNDTTVNSSTPVQVSGLTRAIAVAGDAAFSLALTDDGSVWAWGNNDEGELGDGTFSERHIPGRVANVHDIVAIGVGEWHSLAVAKDGSVWGWGDNSDGQLGTTTPVTQNSPQQIPGISDVVAIGGGFQHSIALKADGTVWTWGGNDYGQLGDGTTLSRIMPSQVLTNVVAIAGGYDHNLAVKRDGTVWAWGGSYGATPKEVSGLSGITHIAAGDYHSMALKHLPIQAVPPGSQYSDHPNVDKSRDPVNTLTGSFTYSRGDIVTPGRGPSPIFSRTYNSNDTRDGPLGRGWTHSYNVRLSSPSSGRGSVTLVGARGRSDDYTAQGDGTFTPPPGIYTALVENADGTYTATQKDQSTWTFDSDGKLISIKDRYGYQTTLTYNASGQLTAISDPAGRGSLTLSYDPTSGRLTSVSDWLSPARVVQYEYDANGRLWKVTDREGKVTTYGYDGASHRLTTITDARGNVAVMNTYDAEGRVATQKDARGLVTGQQTTFTYTTNPDGTKTSTVTYPATSFDANWNPKVEDTYDSQGRIIKRVSRPTAGGTEDATVLYSYDANSNLSSVTDARGNTTNLCYDVDYAGQTIAGSRGNLARRVDSPPTPGANRPVTLYKYDSKDNPIQVIPPKGVGSGATVDCSTDLNASINPVYATDLAYDAATQTKLESITGRWTDPELGQQTAVTKLEYTDAANPGMVTKVIPPRGNTGPTPDYTYAMTFAYGTTGITPGLLLTTTDALGNQTTYDYDAIGRRIKMVDPNGYTTGGVPAEHTWEYTYDQEDRLRLVKAPAPQAGGSQLVTEYRYDDVGNRTVVIDANGQVTKYTYDERDSLQYVVESPNAWPDPAIAPSAAITTEYQYDDAGNLKQVIRATGDAAYERAVEYVYDGLNRLRKETQYPSWPATSPTLVTEYTYDQNSNRLTLTDPLNQTTTFGYDPLNRLTSVTYSDGTTPNVSYTYDANGNRTSMTDGTGTTTYAYDEVSRPFTVTTPGPKTVGYRYDLDGNRTKVIYPDGTAVTYTFDKASRLQSLLDWASRTTSYEYFADGALKRTTNVNSTTADYRYDNARRLLEVWNKQGSSTIGKHTYTLDAIGNRTQVLEDLLQVSQSGGSGNPWAWGDNAANQLGEGAMLNQTTPIQASGLSGITAVGAGQTHSLALKSDGTVWSWGNNYFGSLGAGNEFSGLLGDGTTVANRSAAAQVGGLAGVTAIAAGWYHSLVVKNDGTVWAWGDNAYGQLGDGTLTNRTTPVQVSSLTNVTAVSGGDIHSLALKSDGTVWAWGDNFYGQLGDGTTTRRTTPVQVSGLTGVTAIAAGRYHSLALKTDGTVWAWGDNSLGQLGDGTTTKRVTPVQVGGLTGVTAIAAGQYHSLALRSDGTVWTWGSNSNGQLGDGTTTGRTTPVQVSGLTNGSVIGAGLSHSLAVRTDGTVWAWGANAKGQLGDGTTTNRTTPVQASGLAAGSAVGGGAAYSLAFKSDGTVWASGDDYYGQLGDGNAGFRAAPASVKDLTNVTAVAGGSSHSLAGKNDGTVWAWGGNAYGQLGDGTTASRSTPVQVSGLSNVTAIATGWDHSLALKSDGTVWAWGRNTYGQLGDGTTTNRSTPIQVSGLSGVTAIAAGFGHSLAVKNDGTVWAWGWNANGQLGNGNTRDQTTPVQVRQFTGVANVAAGYDYSLARKSDETVWSWGYNGAGTLGDGTTTDSKTPVQVKGPGGIGYLIGITAIASHYRHSLAVKSDGTVWAWGANWYGQLGDGTTTDRTTPVQTSGLSGVSMVGVGSQHNLAVKSDGTVWAWGNNEAGKLGDTTAMNRSTPVPVSGVSGVIAIAGGGDHSLVATASGQASTTTGYGYDRLYRLVSANGPDGLTTYGYDPVGNRSSLTRGSTTSYSYDRADRLTAAGATSYTVNANGNLVARGSDSFSFDQANRLKTATVGGTASSSVYDGDGKRASKTVGGTTTSYVYDVNRSLPVLLDDGERKYVWGLGLAYAVDTTGTVLVYHPDGLGSVRAVTDSSGTVVQTYRTDEFGVPVETAGSLSQPYQYTGEPRDAESDFVYLRARLYDPAVGRFLSRDPLAGSVDAPGSLNRYAYAGNNPTTLVDPSGLKPQTLIEFPSCVPLPQLQLAPGPGFRLVVGWSWAHCKAKKEKEEQLDEPNQMRVQLQMSRYGATLITKAIALSDSGNGRGVTALQVRMALLQLVPHVPVSLFGDAYKAIVAISERLSVIVAAGGIYPGDNQQVASEVFPESARQRRGQDLWRFDIENLRGHNLRYEN